MLIGPRPLFLLILGTSLTVLAADEKLPAPKTVTSSQSISTLEAVTSEWTKQTGFRFDLAAVDGSLQVQPVGEKPFWEAVETLTKQTKTRISLRESGKVVSLRPVGKGAVVSSLDGPFRFVAREARCKRDLESGLNTYEVHLELHWEPRFEVFRLGEPHVRSAKDDSGKTLAAPSYKDFRPVTGYLAPLRVNLTGVTRSSRKIDLEGTVTATLAEEMLTFKFEDLTKPSQAEQKQVGVRFHEAKKDGKNLSCAIKLVYPDGGPVFESFQEPWRLRANEFTLIDPAGKRHPVTRFESMGGSLTYHLQETQATGKLPENLKGWTAEVRTPGVLRDVEVRFDLKGIELP